MHLMKNLTILVIVVCFFTLCKNEAAAQQSPNSLASILQDLNLDGRVEMLAFGDSITRGVGDFNSPGADVDPILPTPPSEAGYPLRLENLLGISVSNRGIRGENLSTEGVLRFSSTVSGSPADYIVISEGANDVFELASTESLKRDMQALINITKALGKEPIIITIPKPCCEHFGSIPFVESYNQAYRDLADLNKILLADSGRAFAQACPGEECFLLNLPDGLHPNTKGYDAIAETILAALYKIDLFAPGGSALLAQVLGVDPNTIVVKSPVSATPITLP